MKNKMQKTRHRYILLWPVHPILSSAWLQDREEKKTKHATIKIDVTFIALTLLVQTEKR